MQGADCSPVDIDVDDDDVPVRTPNTDKTFRVYDYGFLEAYNSPLASATYIFYTKIKGKNVYVRHACSS